MSAKLPTAVLSQALAEAIDGRRVRVAVFTTFSFDPGFFELNVLPLLFDQSFSQVDKIRRIQLEDALRDIDHLAVYYDRSALSQDAEPARLDYRRIDVRRSSGVFHPKLLLLLVESPETEDEPSRESLLVAVLSANLTRAGWWENLECGHVEAIPEAVEGTERFSFRADLLGMLRRIRRSAPEDEDHSALDAVHEFVLDRAPAREFSRAKSAGRYRTRLFGGRGNEDFAGWLSHLGLDRQRWNLEVVSPFFDPAGADPLELLMQTLKPSQTRVYLPAEPDGTALVSEATYRAVAELGARWSALPPDLVTRGRSDQGERLAPRRLHAKVYRLWRKGEGQVLVVGSVNLTGAGHSHGGAGNLEAAFLVDGSKESMRWWLEPLEGEAERFATEVPREDEGLTPKPVDLSLRFEWASGTLQYRVPDPASEALELTDLSGARLFLIEPKVSGQWADLGEEAAAAMRKHLRSSSFVRVVHSKGEWRVLVREEGMAHRPSLLSDLTPEEIFEYWSLLTPEQRASFIEQIVGLGVEFEGLPLRVRAGTRSQNTLFDRFAGVFHAFGCLRRHIEHAIEAGRLHEAEARLFGAKYDSLPMLLGKSLAAEQVDPILRYITFLSAYQLREIVARDHPRFFGDLDEARRRPLDALLARLPEVRGGVALEGEKGDAFLDWFEPVFLEDLAHLEPSDAHDHA